MATIKTAYVQFGGRVTSTSSGEKHIGAAALYVDKELSNIKGIEVSELTNFEANKQDKYDTYRNRLGEYALALKLIHKYQNALLAQNYDVVVLCTSNSKMYSWLSGKLVPLQVRKLYEDINKQFSSNGPLSLDISVGLSTFLSDKKVYKFCQEKYVGAQLCKLKRGVHIMTAEEIAIAKAATEQKAKEAEQKVLEKDGVSIYDIIQENQGDEFEPIVEFSNTQSED